MPDLPPWDPMKPELLLDDKCIAEREQEPEYASCPDGLYVRLHGLTESELVTVRRWSERQRICFWVVLPMAVLGFWYSMRVSEDVGSLWPFAPFAVLLYALFHLRNGGSAYRGIHAGQRVYVMIGALSPGKGVSDPCYIGCIPVEFASTELRNRAEFPTRVAADVFMGSEVLVFELQSLNVASVSGEAGRNLAEGEIECPGCGHRFVENPSRAECPDCGLVLDASPDADARPRSP